jgi:hypothetical protein
MRSSAHIRQALEPGNGRLRAERGTVGQLIERELENGIMPEAFGVVVVLVARPDHQHAKGQDGSEAVPDPLRGARSGSNVSLHP